jgi:hypothetical protein
MQPGEYLDHLRARLAQYPAAVRAEASRKSGFGQRRLPAIKGDSQVVCSYPYTSTQSWLRIEALVIATACDYLDRRWLGGKVVPFTTLALDYREESQLVVLPEQRARQISKLHITHL